LGGDHSITLPHLRSMRGHGPVAVIMFDSHTDAWDQYYGERYTHGTWMRRAVEGGLVGTGRSVAGGPPGPPAHPTARAPLRDHLTTRGVLAIGPEQTAARIRERVGGRQAFISFDIDVIDPAFAPGTGTPEAGGLSSAQGLEIVRGLTGIDFVGFDVVEVIPGYDPGGVTATLAANLAYEMVSLAALRRARREGQGT